MNGYTLSDLGYTTRDWLIGAGICLLILAIMTLGSLIKVKWWDKLRFKTRNDAIEKLVLIFAISVVLFFSALILIFVPLIVFGLVTGRFF